MGPNQDALSLSAGSPFGCGKNGAENTQTGQNSFRAMCARRRIALLLSYRFRTSFLNKLRDRKSRPHCVDPASEVTPRQLVEDPHFLSYKGEYMNRQYACRMGFLALAGIVCVIVHGSPACSSEIDSLVCGAASDSTLAILGGGRIAASDSVDVLLIYVTFPVQDSTRVPYYYQTFENRFADFYDSLSFGRHIITADTYLAPGDTTAVMADSSSMWYKLGNGGHGRLSYEILEKVYAQSSQAIDTSDCIIVICYESPFDTSYNRKYGQVYGVADLGQNYIPDSLSFDWSGPGATIWVAPTAWEANRTKAQNFLVAHEYGHLVLGATRGHSPNCLPNDPFGTGGNGYYNLYSLMGAYMPWNFGSTPDGFIPLHVMDLLYLGWVSKTEIKSDTTNLKIRDLRVAGGQVYQLSMKSDEYYLISNHQQTGADRAYPGKGLLIWHIKENKFWDLECADGMFTGGQPDTQSGKDSLDAPYYYGRARAADFFGGSPDTCFNDSTNPNTRGYASACHYEPQNVITKIAVENIHTVSDTLGVDGISVDLHPLLYGGTTVAPNNSQIFGCPGWDGTPLIFTVTVAECDGTPIPGIKADSIKTVIPYYCYGDTVRADSSTNANGKTTISLRHLGHGCSEDAEAFKVWINGFWLWWANQNVTIRTVDLFGDDCRVTAEDAEEFDNLGEFRCVDYNFNNLPPDEESGYVNCSLQPGGKCDFQMFNAHYWHPIKVTSPDGDSSWVVGSQQAITWVDSDANNSYVTLVLSKDSGSTFPDTIATAEPNDGSYTWTIPGSVVPAGAGSLNTYRVKAIVYDNVGGYIAHSAADTSDVDFAITWGTPTCGTISSNTTWSGSIYVPCDVVVSSGAQLTVSPGTLVRFAQSDSSHSGADTTKCELIVQGTLTADGTSQSKPTFSSATSSPAAGDWRGIRLRPHNTNNLLDNCVIKYAYTGIEAESTTASVDSCTISYFTNDGIKAIASAVVIRKNTIELGTSGVRGIELTSSTSGEVSGSAGTGHHNSITCSSSNTNTTYGILSSGSASADLEYTWIDGVKYGIKCSGSSGPAIAHNWIQNTKNNGIQTADDAAPSIHYTTIQGFQGTGLTAIDYSNPYLGADTDSGSNRVIPSQTYNYYVANLTEYTMMAERNWWNTSTPSSGKFYGDVDYSPVNSTDPGTSYELPLVPDPGSPPATPYAVQNYPNPFNPTTTIEYGVSAPNRRVRIAVYDLVGRVVAVLVDAPKPAGRYAATWDGRNARGEAVASGVYFYEVEIDEFRQAKKLVVLK